METPPALPSTSLYEALAQETERLKSAHIAGDEGLDGVLEGLIDRPHSLAHGTIHRSSSRLSLVFKHLTSRSAVDQRFSKALKALAVVLVHSFRLNKFPELKVEFWRYVLGATLVDHGNVFRAPGMDEWIWMAEDERFPIFDIDMDHKGKDTDAYMDALFSFMTTPPENDGLDARFASECPGFASPNTIGVGLEFAQCKLTPDHVRLIRELLDRVYASPTRQFAIRTLDLSNQKMTAAHLEHVSEILAKNHRLYRIENLHLRKLLKPKATAEEVQMMRNMVAGAFAESAVAHESQKSGLRTLYLSGTPVGLQSVAAFCSALRYGCQLESLSIGWALKKLDKADREQCWRWLAYGIFHPRSRKLAADSKFRAIDLPDNPFERVDVAAFIRTLSDPAGELVYRGAPSSKHQAVEKGELVFCTIKQGARFYPTAKVGPQVLRELGSEMELEVLCQQGGWTCAVLPGIGLGWVKNDQILSTERETIDSSYRNAISVEWGFASLSRKEVSLKAFRSLVECVGSQLKSLNLEGVVVSHDPFGVLPAILEHCVNLERLVFSSAEINDQGIAQLLDALDGPLGRKLLSLNISSNDFSDAIVEKIAQTLSNPARIPALQDLRMVRRGMGSQCYASLHQALHVNKTLRYLGLQRRERHLLVYLGVGGIPPILLVNGDPAFPGDDEGTTTAGRGGIDRDFQGELLTSSLPMKAKLAFLSAIQHETSAGKPRGVLDAFMVSIIFKFAAEQVRRRIFWEGSIGAW